MHALATTENRSHWVPAFAGMTRLGGMGETMPAYAGMTRTRGRLTLKPPNHHFFGGTKCNRGDVRVCGDSIRSISAGTTGREYK